MAKVTVRMLTTASGPNGTLHEGKLYYVEQAVADQWATPHPELGTVYAKVVSYEDLDGERVNMPDTAKDELAEGEGGNAPPPIPKPAKK
jgi:hypothetical protein